MTRRGNALPLSDIPMSALKGKGVNSRAFSDTEARELFGLNCHVRRYESRRSPCRIVPINRRPDGQSNEESGALAAFGLESERTAVLVDDGAACNS